MTLTAIPCSFGHPIQWIQNNSLPHQGGFLDGGIQTQIDTGDQSTSLYSVLALTPRLHFEAHQLTKSLLDDLDQFLEQSGSFLPYTSHPASFHSEVYHFIQDEQDDNVHFPSSFPLLTSELDDWICPLTLCTLSYELGELCTHSNQVPLQSFEPSSEIFSTQDLPLVWVTQYQAVYVWDHCKEQGLIWGYTREEGIQLLKLLQKTWPVESTDRTLPSIPTEFSLVSDYSASDYKDQIQTILDQINKGEFYQLNLTTRLTSQLSSSLELFLESSLEPSLSNHSLTQHQSSDLDHLIYGCLRSTNPANFGAFIRLSKEQSIYSLSPERLVKWTHKGMIWTSPIKGTRPLGSTDKEDQALQMTLLESIKDRAEHLMIVDLERNDLHRICQPNSVYVNELCALKTFPSVHHLVSTIIGHLRKNLRFSDLLRALFPGGSITGAPKIRAMKWIKKLEKSPREIYCGGIGYLDPRGGGDLNIPIRTAWRSNQTIKYGTGGGIVADSTAEEEWKELWVKTRAFQECLSRPKAKPS